ncbi:MAG: RluA family pseudouridine synthase [Armatimonadota bacterium]|nr:RluA family pseudouridine synthase [Armatimonadota bacterium]
MADQLPDQSRARLQALIAGGHVSVAAEPTAPGAAGPPAPVVRVRPSYRVRAGDLIVVEIPPAHPTELRPEPIPLEILYEDGEVLVINKPAGLVVHPGAGRPTGTLAHAVLAHCPDLPGIGGAVRPGIVHRLDKDTSGLLVVAKTEAALRELQAQIQARRARRDYLALVHGAVAIEQGTIDAPLGRDARYRTRMAVVASGRRAVTHYRVVERFADATLLELRLGTGRTHQIRVHCASIGHPVVGDRLYGRRPNPWGLRRQALHAFRLTFAHPGTGREMSFLAPLPADMEAALGQLREERDADGTPRRRRP